jgi:hypothetical protein
MNVKAKRADGRMAFEAAPPRLRQSQIERPHGPIQPMQERRGWIERLFRKNA